MLIRENINFERGLNPNDSLKIGNYYDLDEKFGDLMVPKLISTDTHKKWSTYNAIKIIVDIIDTKLSRELKYRFIRGEDPNYVCLDILNRVDFKYKELYLRKIQKWMKKPFWKKKIDGDFNFERGKNPYKTMKIGYIRPINQLKKDYDQIQKLIHSSEYSEFRSLFIEEALKLMSDTVHFGWGNIQYNFKNMGREELYPFEQLVQKYTKLLELD